MASNIKKIFFDEELLKILVCPLTRSELQFNKESNELISKKAGLAFPIVDGIPIMLIDEARSTEKS